jgi:hypothetical protein
LISETTKTKKIKTHKMKNVIKSFAAVVALLAFSSDAFAQLGDNQQTATVSATIITPITLTKTTDMNFGNLSVLSNTGGYIDMNPSSVRTPNGGVSTAGAAGTVTAAAFTVNGANNYTYVVTMPAGVTTISNGTDNLTVDNFVCSLGVGASPTGTLNASGTQNFTVGARLNVPANSSAGTYNQGSNTFQITVNYN